MEPKNEATELDAIMAASAPTTGTPAGPTITIVNLTPPKPSVGRIVHYREPRVEGGHEIRAAIVTRVWSDTCVNLTVFGADGGVYGVKSATAWSWPERV